MKEEYSSRLIRSSKEPAVTSDDIPQSNGELPKAQTWRQWMLVKARNSKPDDRKGKGMQGSI